MPNDKDLEETIKRMLAKHTEAIEQTILGVERRLRTHITTCMEGRIPPPSGAGEPTPQMTPEEIEASVNNTLARFYAKGALHLREQAEAEGLSPSERADKLMKARQDEAKAISRSSPGFVKEFTAKVKMRAEKRAAKKAAKQP